MLEEINDAEVQKYYDHEVFVDHIYKNFRLPDDKILPPGSNIPIVLLLIIQPEEHFPHGNFDQWLEDYQ